MFRCIFMMFDRIYVFLDMLVDEERIQAVALQAHFLQNYVNQNGYKTKTIKQSTMSV